jgi:hypothetical protein
MATGLSDIERVCRVCGVAKPPSDFAGRRCKRCSSSYHKARYAADPERSKLAARRWRKSNPDGTRQRTWKYMLRQRYGITIADYMALLEKQEGVCAICRGPETYPGRERLAVDHCHATGIVRGLLCNHCNRAIGFLRENPEVVDRAANYLRQAQEAVING